jgi:hypothetical protein
VGVNSGQSPLECVALTQLVAHSDGLLLQRVTRVWSANVLRRRNVRVEWSHKGCVAMFCVLRAGHCHRGGPPALLLEAAGSEHWQNFVELR